MARRRNRLASVAAALVVVVGPGAALAATSVKAPPSGAKYSGTTEQEKRVTLQMSEKAVELLAFQFNCGRKAVGSTSVQSIPLTRSDRGYRLKVSTNGIVSYSDEQPDENAKITIRARFSRTAKTIAGWFQLQTPRCHSSGTVEWRAKQSK